MDVLKDIRQQQHVSPKVQIVIVAKGASAKGLPDYSSVAIVLIGDAFEVKMP